MKRNVIKLIFLAILFGPVSAAPDQSILTCKGDCKVDTEFFTLIRNLEGFSPFSYTDTAGNSTICFGHLIKEDENFSEPMTGEECEKILEQDVAATEAEVNKMVTAEILVTQHDALTSLAYNAGPQTLKKSTLLKKVNSGEHCEVPSEFLKYDHVKIHGKEIIVPGLKLRRTLEANLYAKVP